MTDTPDILKKIVARKREEIAERSARVSQAELAGGPGRRPMRRVALSLPCRPGSMPVRPAVIAEIKKASPSKGVLREDFRPAEIAQQLCARRCRLPVGADRCRFLPGRRCLSAGRRARPVELPVIRKDFIVDPYQVVEARAIGADCILLIVACLDDAQLHGLNDLAHAAGHGRADRGARWRRAGARADDRQSPDRHQQPQSAHLRGEPADHAGPVAADRRRIAWWSPRAASSRRTMCADARNGVHGFPGRRGLHARRRPGCALAELFA